jgi:hypothetical protein
MKLLTSILCAGMLTAMAGSAMAGPKTKPCGTTVWVNTENNYLQTKLCSSAPGWYFGQILASHTQYNQGLRYIIYIEETFQVECQFSDRPDYKNNGYITDFRCAPHSDKGFPKGGWKYIEKGGKVGIIVDIFPID